MVLIGRGDVGHGNREAVVRRHSAARYVFAPSFDPSVVKRIKRLAH